MAFNLFPYSNFHKLNLDWVLQQIKSAMEQLTAAAQTVSGYETRLSSAEQINTRQDSTLANHGQRITANENNIETLQIQSAGHLEMINQQGQEIRDLQAADVQLGQRISGKLDAVNGVAQNLTVTAAPTSPMGVANKAYVDQHGGGGSSLPSIYNVRQVNGAWQLDSGVVLDTILSQLEEGYAVAIRLHIDSDNSLDLWTVDWQRTEEVFRIHAVGIIESARIYDLTITGGEPPVITVTTYANVQMLTPPASTNRGQVPAVVGVGGRFSFQYQTPVWAPIEVTVESSAAQIEPVDNHVYQAGTLVSLAVSNAPATGSWSIIFTSGSTATTVSGLSGVLGLETFRPAANTIYEINVLDNRAVVGAWEVSA